MEREERGAEHRSINPRSQDHGLTDQRLAGACPRIVPDLEEISRLPVEALPALLLQLAAVQTAIAARLAQAPAQQARHDGDRLLAVDEAAALLGLSRDTMYSSPALRSIRVKVGARVLFSARKLQYFIERQAGRG